MLTIGFDAIATAPLRADAGHPHGEATVEPSHDGGHGNDDHGMHGMMAIPPGQPVPQVEIEIVPDPIAGWNLHVDTMNWTFAPESVNTTSNFQEGHAHLYVNGEKVTRLYGEWYYIPSLPVGEHTLTVGLNANGHEMLMYDGEPIQASVDIVVPETP